MIVPGNMWGICPNGTEAVGCGRSETFRNCADVSVITSTGGLPPAFAGDFRIDYPFLIFYRDLDMPRNVFPLVVRYKKSHAAILCCVVYVWMFCLYFIYVPIYI